MKIVTHEIFRKRNNIGYFLNHRFKKNIYIKKLKTCSIRMNGTMFMENVDFFWVYKKLKRINFPAFGIFI